MFDLPVCISCGYPTDGVALLFRHLRTQRVEAAAREQDIPAERALLEPTIVVETGDLFDLLGVRHTCCRAHLATAMRFQDRY